MFPEIDTLAAAGIIGCIITTCEGGKHTVRTTSLLCGMRMYLLGDQQNGKNADLDEDLRSKFAV